MNLLKTDHDRAVKDWIQKDTLESVGLIQGQLSSIIVSMDIAEKAADVKVAEVSGVCPSRIVLVAVMGSAAAVETAMDAVKQYEVSYHK